jgi:predicted MFS family arabinose efflux permease
VHERQLYIDKAMNEDSKTVDAATIPGLAAATPTQSPPDSLNTSPIDKSTSHEPSIWHRIFWPLLWMPPWCRWDPQNPPVFSMPMNVLFGFAGAFTVANLYYNHPILNILARDFGVSYETSSHIPTLMQAGYATGLLFLCPLGDVFRRRYFVLSMIFFTSSMWIGLCVTNNFNVFQAISFITAITTVTPQMMLPLVGDLAPPHKRAMALSIVTSGNLLGVLLARILSGIVTQYTSWRNIYWLALGLQYLIFSLLWLFMPDYPSTNPDGMNYFKMLWSILTLCKKYPVLVQAGLVSYCTSACFTSFWTTLTFLLAGTPYHYDSLVIGLFALIGLAGMLLGPVYAKVLIQKFVPLFSVVIGELINITGIVIGTYTGLTTVAGPILQAFGMDAGMIITQIANRSAIYAIEPKGRNRVNTAFMLMTFMGQLTGTSAGNKLYAQGGWIASGSLSVAFIAFSFVVCAVRGPHVPEKTWFGWSGGFKIRKGLDTEKRSALMPQIKVKEDEERVVTPDKVEKDRIKLSEDGAGIHMSEK